MKTTLSLLKTMPVAGLLCTAVLLLFMPVRLRALSPGEADTLQVYRDSIRWSSNNVQKSEWLERAAVYSLRVGDTASLLSFKIDQAYFRFSSGNYVEAFDSLILIEKKSRIICWYPPYWLPTLYTSRSSSIPRTILFGWICMWRREYPWPSWKSI